MFGLSMSELIVIAIIGIVLFGTKDLPKTLRKVAKGVNDFKKVASDAQRSWHEVRNDVAKTIMSADLTEDIYAPVKSKVKDAGETSETEVRGANETGETGAQAASETLSLAGSTGPDLHGTDGAENQSLALSPSAAFQRAADLSFDFSANGDGLMVSAGASATEVSVSTSPVSLRLAAGTVSRNSGVQPSDHGDDNYQERKTES